MHDAILYTVIQGDFTRSEAFLTEYTDQEVVASALSLLLNRSVLICQRWNIVAQTEINFCPAACVCLFYIMFICLHLSITVPPQLEWPKYVTTFLRNGERSAFQAGSTCTLYRLSPLGWFYFQCVLFFSQWKAMRVNSRSFQCQR